MNLRAKQILFGLFLLLALPAIYFMGFYLEFKESDIKTISGTLKFDPEFYERSGTTGPCLILYLNEFENQFNTDSFSYHVLKKEKFKSQVKKGDKIFISVKKDKSTSWVDDINRGLDIVRIMELWNDDEVFISMKEYNSYRKEDHKFAYLIWMIFLGVYLYWLRKKLASQKTDNNHFSH